jgi:cation:H+ antiporter
MITFARTPVNRMARPVGSSHRVWVPDPAAINSPPTGTGEGRTMFNSLSLPLLTVVFTATAVVVWVAGVQLSNNVDVLSNRLGLGEAVGGLLLLAVATDLPELAIVSSAALHGDLGIAIGNILGGVAIQTVVLVYLDAASRRREPLTYQAASLALVLEGGLVIALLAVAIAGSRLPASLLVARVAPGAFLIVVLWVVGVWLIGRAQSGLPWHEQGDAPGGQEEPMRVAEEKQDEEAQKEGLSTGRAAAVFGGAAVVTLIGGVLLERSGDAIAARIHMTGVLFGATVLAAACALPEFSTGLTLIKLEDYQLAVSDIFGGNAFLPVLFLPAGLLSGSAVLPQVQSTDLYLTALAVILTAVYIFGLIFRPRSRILRMGPDSLTVLVLYLVGMAGLFVIARG